MRRLAVVLALLLALGRAEAQQIVLTPAVVPTLAGGLGNVFTLTPQGYTLAAYSPLQIFSFQISAEQAQSINNGVALIVQGAAGPLATLPLYAPDGVTRVGSGGLQAGYAYLAMYQPVTPGYEDRGPANGGPGFVLVNQTITAEPFWFTPQGRLTAVSGQPVQQSNVVDADRIFYTPYLGSTAVEHNGFAIQNVTFGETILTINSAYNPANTVFDVFAIRNTDPNGAALGAFSLVAGPCDLAGGPKGWPSQASRGSGSGTADLVFANGLWRNAHTFNGCNAGNTIQVVEMQAIWLGSFLTSAAGKISVRPFPAPGESALLSIYNAYNKVPFHISVQNGAGWSNPGAGWRVLAGNPANSLKILDGNARDMIPRGQASVMLSAAGLGGGYGLCFGLDSTVSCNGPQSGATLNSPATITVGAPFAITPQLGVHTYTALEQAPTNPANISGSNANLIFDVVN